MVQRRASLVAKYLIAFTKSTLEDISDGISDGTERKQNKCKNLTL